MDEERVKADPLYHKLEAMTVAHAPVPSFAESQSATIVFARHGQVAQSVERSPEKAGVGGSIPSLATYIFIHLQLIYSKNGQHWSPNSADPKSQAFVVLAPLAPLRGSHYPVPISDF